MKFAIFFLFLIILFWFTIPNNNKMETFQDPFMQYIGKKVHIKLNNKRGIHFASYQSPSDHGYHGCAIVPCPNGFEDDLVCWCCCGYH